MRATFRATVSIGILTFPVKVYKAADDLAPRFHQLHAADGGRVGIRRYCKSCGEVLEGSEIARGYECETGEHVVLTDEELDRGILPGGTASIEVLHFTPGELDPCYVAGTYYLGPGDMAAAKERRRPPEALLRAFGVLTAAVADAGVSGVCRLVMRERESLGALRSDGTVLMLDQLRWPEEIRDPAGADWLDLVAATAAREGEFAAARALVANMTRRFDRDEHHDAYRERIAALIEAKRAGLPAAAAAAPAGGKLLDLMEALEASVHASASPNSAADAEAGAFGQLALA